MKQMGVCDSHNIFFINMFVGNERDKKIGCAHEEDNHKRKRIWQTLVDSKNNCVEKEYDKL